MFMLINIFIKFAYKKINLSILSMLQISKFLTLINP